MFNLGKVSKLIFMAIAVIGVALGAFGHGLRHLAGDCKATHTCGSKCSRGDGHLGFSIRHICMKCGIEY